MEQSIEPCFLHSVFPEGRTRHGVVTFVVEIFLLKVFGSNSVSVRRLTVYTDVQKLHFNESVMCCDVIFQ